MREIGGFIEISESRGEEYHTDAIALNCGRSCLEYLIRASNIKRLFIPYFLCASARNLCKKCNCEFEFYNIDNNFKPIINRIPGNDELIVIINYYGQLEEGYIQELKQKYKNVVIDNTQAFFLKPSKKIDTFYSCRKYFGVPDGAYLYTNDVYDDTIEKDISYNRMNYLLGRYELGPQKFYSEYVENNSHFVNESIKYMSKLTSNLLRNEDYDFVKNRRSQNFEFLHKNLSSINQLKLKPYDGPFMYPLFLENGNIVKDRLIANKIYVPTLWPATFDVAAENSVEWNFAKNIVPLPIDQRYGIDDMKYMLGVLKDVLS